MMIGELQSPLRGSVDQFSPIPRAALRLPRAILDGSLRERRRRNRERISAVGGMTKSWRSLRGWAERQLDAWDDGLLPIAGRRLRLI